LGVCNCWCEPNPEKARVAVARKLAVLLHHLWVTGEVYEAVHRKPAQPVPAAA